jgi:hypothetical protein
VPATLKSFDPKKRPKKNRDGYNGSSDVLLIERKTIAEFLSSADPTTLLFEANALVWSEEEKKKYWERTPADLREYMDDLKCDLCVFYFLFLTFF